MLGWISAGLTAISLISGLWTSHQNKVDNAEMRRLSKEFQEEQEKMDWETSVIVKEKILENKAHNEKEFNKQINSQKKKHRRDLEDFERQTTGFLDKVKAEARINNIVLTSGSPLAQMTFSINQISQDRSTLTDNQKDTIESFISQRDQMLNDADNDAKIVMAGKESPEEKKKREEKERLEKEEEERKKAEALAKQRDKERKQGGGGRPTVISTVGNGTSIGGKGTSTGGKGTSSGNSTGSSGKYAGSGSNGRYR